uniref:Uncharacterized protein n=1 Tax=Glossina austeni TaxID=7395 RepID=A0A1A9UD77_GLOAU
MLGKYLSPVKTFNINLPTGAIKNSNDNARIAMNRDIVSLSIFEDYRLLSKLFDTKHRLFMIICPFPAGLSNLIKFNIIPTLLRNEQQLILIFALSLSRHKDDHVHSRTDFLMLLIVPKPDILLCL